MQKKSKIIIISVVTAILLVVGVFMAVTIVGADNSAQAVATEKLSLGQKFLLDLEYDKAVAEFQAVIDIEPKNVDAYIGLADAYIGMGEEEKAIETLEKGLSETGDETIRAKLDEMKKPEETTVAETTTTPEVTTTPEETTTPEVTTVEDNRENDPNGGYWIHKYDTNGNKISSSHYFEGGDFEYIIYYKYDQNGILIKTTKDIADFGYEVYSREEFVYDSRGNIIEETFLGYNSDDDTLDVIWRNVYEYNNSKKIKETKYGWKNELEAEIEYLDNGVVCFTYYSDGKISAYIEENSNGNRIKEISYDSDGNVEYYFLSEYYPNGLIKKFTDYNEDGSIDDIYTYEYDSQGREIKCTEYNNSGKIRYIRTREYGSNGRQIRMTLYKPDGTIQLMREWDLEGNLIKEYGYDPYQIVIHSNGSGA